MRLSYFFLFLIVGFSLSLGSCSYTLTGTEGARVSSAQVQEIKLGRTTELELVKFLGPPSKRERMLSGNDRWLYEYTEIKSITFPWGYQAKGFLDKEVDEIFEVILKDGVVQSYRYLKP